MDFIEFKLWKLLVLVALAAVYGFWRGFTGRAGPGRREPPSK